MTAREVGVQFGASHHRILNCAGVHPTLPASANRRLSSTSRPARCSHHHAPARQERWRTLDAGRRFTEAAGPRPPMRCRPAAGTNSPAEKPDARGPVSCNATLGRQHAGPGGPPAV